MNQRLLLSLAALLALSRVIHKATAAIPRKEAFFPYQLVNHNDDDDNNNNNNLPVFWTQRFYSMGEHFRGPGSPIFLILGGEGAIEPSNGILYPFVANDLAVSYGAFILQPEHRFYGTSQPISQNYIDQARQDGQVDPRVELLTPDQAIQDAIRLVRFVRDRLGCSRDRFSPLYCPVITVGGSYPGFLSAMARTAYPHVVDMAYAASAPMKFYAQTMETTGGDEYYQHITNQMDVVFPKCARNIHKTLVAAIKQLQDQQPVVNASLIGACSNMLPKYINNNTQTFIDEIVMMVGYTLANFNMAFYPPTSETDMQRACQTIFNPTTTTTTTTTTVSSADDNDNDDDTDPFDTLRRFFLLAFASTKKEEHEHCFDMSMQLPTGPLATISAGDWSGVGTGASGESWDFQTCTLCVERINMAGCLPRRIWTIEWLQDHCQKRFNVEPRPYELVKQWKFDDLAAAGASNILFTNGLVDGWSVAGIKANLSDTLVAMNFEQGAHHSDLSYYKGIHDDATEDIKHGRNHIRALLAKWLEELPGGRMSQQARVPVEKL